MKTGVKYDFDRVIERRNTCSMKWSPDIVKQFGLSERFDEDTIAVFTADMDFQCAQPIIDALKKVAEHGIFGYSSSFGVPEYTDAVRRWFREKHNWEFDADSIVFSSGTVEALRLSVEAFSEKGDGILITYPVYGPFTSTITGTGRKVVNSQLINSDGYYTMDFEDIEEKAKDPDVKMFILCNPQNPTGRVWTKEELKRLAEICERNNLILVSDEVHCDIVRKGIHYVPAAKVGAKENIVALTAVNKTFNCAGLASSHAIIEDRALREKYQKAAGLTLQNPFSIAATVAAYTQGDEWVEQVNAYLDETINWAVDFIEKNMPGVKVWKPEGTYVLWMDFEGSGLSPEEVHDRIYNRANVLLESGSAFDPEQGAKFERICLPSSRSVIREAFRRIAKEINADA